jgi:hypothetical protein
VHILYCQVGHTCFSVLNHRLSVGVTLEGGMAVPLTTSRLTQEGSLCLGKKGLRKEAVPRLGQAPAGNTRHFTLAAV